MLNVVFQGKYKASAFDKSFTVIKRNQTIIPISISTFKAANCNKVKLIEKGMFILQ